MPAVSILFVLFSASLKPQIIQGKIIDAESHDPIPLANVKIYELNIGSAANENGEFFIYNVPEGNYILEVSHIGYKKSTLNIKIKFNDNRRYYIHLYPAPIQSSSVIITGFHPNNKYDEIFENTNVLKGMELQKELGLTLAAVLKNETGFALRSMGPASSRPVIRGLGGDRIMISEDGSRTNDLSSTSPDHAVAVETFTIERIEVIRGPKILLFGSSSVGGVVNIIRNEIPDCRPEKISGSVGGYYESSNNGFLGGGTLTAPVNKFIFRGEYSYRDAKNQKTPSGVLNNTEILTTNTGAGFSFIDDFGYFGASIREFESDYGIPGGFVGAHPFGVDIKMKKRLISLKFQYNLDAQFLKNIALNFNRTYYRHFEFEAKDLIGAEFLIKNFDADIKFEHKSIGSIFEGIFGAGVSYRDFNIGGYIFTPPVKSIKVSSFIFESFSALNVDFQFSIRGDIEQIIPKQSVYSQKESLNEKKNFMSFSASVSALKEMINHIYAGINLSKTARFPTIEELYSGGPHLAAYSYEVGNPELKTENGFSGETFLYYKDSRYFTSASTFYYYFWNYIIPRNTGEINWRTTLPIYETAGIEARIYGAEARAEVKLFFDISLNASLSYTRGLIIETKESLPAIPPIKSKFEISRSKNGFGFGASVEIAGDQNKVDVFEEPTPGYAIFNSYIQYLFVPKNIVCSFSFNIDNIFNKTHRNHLSRVKSIMPESGRNIRITSRLFF